MKDATTRSYRHLGPEDRATIQQELDMGHTLARIAGLLGVAVSTVQREIVRNRRFDGPSQTSSRDTTDCKHLHTCQIRGLCADSAGCKARVCKRCPNHVCQDICTSYSQRICETIRHAPFVCNACARYARCILMRYRYSATSAHTTATDRARSARTGIDMTKDEMDAITATIMAGRAQGQSIHHIFATNTLACSERSFYRYVEKRKLDVISLHLPKSVRYKKRKKATTVRHKSGFYRGHEYADYLELPLSERAYTTQIDTVSGKKGEKKCILSLQRIDLHFQIYLLLQEKTKRCVVEALDWLEESSEGHFADIFGLGLFDRGCEFDDIAGLERSKTGTGFRMSAYFTEPSRPDQKGSCEKNHVELRKIVPKGSSLEALDNYTLAEICSHVNSTVRKGCGDKSPMQLAQFVLPGELLDSLGLRRIEPKDVISKPGILYQP